MDFPVKQDCKYNPESDAWSCRLWLEGGAGKLDKVDRVFYTLHPAYPSPVKVVTSRETGFALTVESWGGFPFSVRVLREYEEDVVTPGDLEPKYPDGTVARRLDDPGEGAGPQERFELAMRFKKLNAFKYARGLLAEALQDESIERDADLKKKARQQLALCTYKEPSIPLGKRLDEALGILNDPDDSPGSTDNPETLGLAGAIHKRKWEADGQRSHLEQSLHYYRRGYEAMKTLDPADDDYDGGAFTGINTSFILDRIAHEQEIEATEAGVASSSADRNREEARKIREELIPSLELMISNRKEWWLYATLAEACLGTEEYPDAKRWLTDGLRLDVSEWELESTARQLASLLLIQREFPGGFDERKKTGGWAVLEESFGFNTESLFAAFTGKIGLALSGGGFRASLFHIGVLARLAELDVLRHVEALSCVSGGSIIGAHYYLAVRRRLEKKPDDEITREDYIEIVQAIEQDFLKGVQKNVRTRVIASFPSNLRMIFQPNQYSRTERLGALYESGIFFPAQSHHAASESWLNNLFVHPAVRSEGGLRQDDNFTPKFHNWRRAAKVPMLMLNATSLNTGHNWQFTASWMGEPPEGVDSVDANERLRRMYYAEAPPSHANVRLGDAVAASSCVPGLFDPIVIDELYPERTVRLVDGGVHDNQGIQGLLDQDCTLILVSDAAGQMNSESNPSKGIISVLLRTSSILQARVRGAEFDQLAGLNRLGQLRGLMFVHLKKGLKAESVSWRTGKDETLGNPPAGGPTEPEKKEKTEYGILKEVQAKLAGLRTDLDSFTDVEAASLMTSGYRMTEWEFDQKVEWPREKGRDRAQWRFLEVEGSLRGEATAHPSSADVIQQLEVGKSPSFKIWKLSKPLRCVSRVFLVALLAAIAVTAYFAWDATLISARTVGSVALTVIAIVVPIVVAYFFGKFVSKTVNYRETLTRVLAGILLSLCGWLVASIHLRIFDKLFLMQGRLPKRKRTARPLSPAGDGELS